VAGGHERVVRAGYGVDEGGLADAGLAGDQEKSGAGLEVLADRGKLGSPPGDPFVVTKNAAIRVG
jgi:hypothetical protein